MFGSAPMKLQASELTFLAESLGMRAPPPLRYLAALARHADPVVREGVVYGLAPHASTPRAAEVLLSMLDDLSPAVRTAAKDAIA